MIFSGLICKLFGHKWRRLTVKERMDMQPLPITEEMAALPKSQLRRCGRCGAMRIVKARKPKQEATE